MTEYLKVFHDIGIEIKEMLQSSRWKQEMSEEVGIGASGFPTRMADRLAEDIIIKHVEDNDLPLNIISEERGIIQRGYKRNLVVDPVDGTFNLVRNIPLYAVSMALAYEDISSIDESYIMNLANGDWYHSTTGNGLTVNGRKRPVQAKRSGTYLVHLSSGLDRRSLLIISQSRKFRYLGCAALELAMVASGSADVSAHLGRSAPLRNIDVAAGIHMVREMGGSVVDGHGEQFNLGMDPRERKNLIAVYTPSLLDVLL